MFRLAITANNISWIAKAFLTWSKPDQRGERYFVISCPQWRAAGFSKLVRPAKAITDALIAQEVIHRTGSHDERGAAVEIPMLKKSFTLNAEEDDESIGWDQIGMRPPMHRHPCRWQKSYII